MAEPREKLGWIEFGRGGAALAVVLSHSFLVAAPDYMSFMFLWGRWGVAFFFVLSGFIIYHVHRDDLGRIDKAKTFAWRRFIRIFPTYWLVLFIALFVRQNLGNPEYRLDIDSLFIIKQIFMIPQDLFVPVAWTLRHELLFYAVFLVAIFDLRVGTALFVVWLAAIIYQCINETPCGLITIGDARCSIETKPRGIVTHYLNLYFFCGMAIAAILERQRIWAATFASTFLALVLYASDVTLNSVLFLAAAQLVACCCLVCWAAALSQSFRAPAFAIWLGTISYPVYLFHLTAYQMAHGILKRTGTFQLEWLTATILALVLSLAIAHVIAVLFEKPLFAILKPNRGKTTKVLVK